MNIHPGNKQDVGKRLAYWTLAKDYNQKEVVYSGPLYDGMKVEGDKIRVTFRFTTTSLVPKTDKLIGFEIAGVDGQFLPAEAVVEETTILVFNKKIKAPTQVRYAFKNASEANLFNGVGLPASSFSSEE